MKLTYQPLNPECWQDLELLFGKNGACGGCWCMWWRYKRKDFVAGKGDSNRAAFKDIVYQGNEPGFLAYHGAEAVAWMAVEPRENYPVMERSRVLKRVDNQPVWAVSCFFIKKDYRHKGVSTMLLEYAKKFARKRGAHILEGYPVAPKKDHMPAVFAWTGMERSFIKAGFEEVARRSETRPIMRFQL